MAYLLHLSDLHMAPGSAHDALGDAKIGIVGSAQRQSHFALLEDSLTALGKALLSGGVSLDSIVITGDVTERGNPVAFELLPQLLDRLGKAHPGNDRVLVVPGNHDVKRGTAPSSRSRYKSFLRLRDFGFRTAWLEGVDMSDVGDVWGAPPMPPVIEAKDGTFVLVGLNSANHSMVKVSADPILDAHFKGLRSAGGEGRKLSDAFQRMKDSDMARVSAAQMRHATDWLEGVEPDMLRIVALHHQLLPVSVNEEIKPFESVTNLGELREWIAVNGVDVVLHGHKHVAQRRRDRHKPALGLAEHQFLVVSAPAVEPAATSRAALGWLIRTEPPTPRIHGLHYQEVPTHSAGTYSLASLPDSLSEIDDAPRSGLIEGRTALDVHKKIMGIADSIDDLPRPLICRVFEGASALTFPETYPNEDGSDRDATWFKETVEFWQSRDPQGSMTFSHGQRLAPRDGLRDQIEEIAGALNLKAETSRAFAVLVDREDVAGTADFPAFALAQFMIRGGRLDVVAYFRKQEMPHWWPINVAELSHMQAEVIASLINPVDQGSITTVAGIPRVAGSVPRLLVTEIDKLSLNPARLFELALPLFVAVDVPDDFRSLWERVFADWLPPEKAPLDGSPLPVRGLRDLAAVVVNLADATAAAPASGGRVILQELTRLVDDNAEYRAKDPGDKEARLLWTKRVKSGVDRVMEEVDAIVAKASS